MIIIYPLEVNTRTNFDQILINLGYIIDESMKECNVFKERPKSKEQSVKLGGKRPDYVIYKSGTDQPICIVEAKKIGENLEDALEQAIDYAKTIDVPLAFATNDSYFLAYHVIEDKILKIDGAEVQQFLDEKTLLNFIDHGAEITINPVSDSLSKEEILTIFKNVNKLLRKEGLRTGQERFSAISDLLFLKLLNDNTNAAEFMGNRFLEIDDKYSWDNLISKSEEQIVDFLNDSIRGRLIEKYGDIFDNQFVIKKPIILKEVLTLLDPIDLSSTSSDVKGDAFEFFLKNITNGNKDLGEYYTPRHIIKQIVSLVDPKYGDKVYDPFCGTGGFLTESFKHLSLKSNMEDTKIRKTIKQDSIYGREISSTARIAKMNMILFGDGNTNIEQMDTLENPIKNKFDIAISNIPYSQKSEYGSLYKIKSDNADAICVQHMWDSLKEDGKLAVIVPDTFLYESGVIEEVRKGIMNNSKYISVVSLPRGVFNPYTPTKTSVLIAEKSKGNKMDFLYNYVVDNDGFELGARRRPLGGESDLRDLRTYYEDKVINHPKSNVVPRNEIDWNSLSLLAYDYMEDIPSNLNDSIYLGDHIYEPEIKRLESTDVDEYAVLQISQTGATITDVFDNDGGHHKHKVVNEGDIVFNPHRINIGSIATIPNLHTTMVVSPIYEIFRIDDALLDPYFITTLLKTDIYKRIINHYAIGGARSIFKFDQLKKVKIPTINLELEEKVINISNDINEALERKNKAQEILISVIDDMF